MTTDRFDLSKKAALITGSAGLLGFQHAAALLECGATVICTDIAEHLLEDTRVRLMTEFPNGRILAYAMDVTCMSSILEVQKKLFEHDIQVNILVNNAAIDPKVRGDTGLIQTSRLEHFSLEQWDLQIAVGLTGAFLCSQVFGTSMAKAGNGGIILNIASDLSVVAPDQRLYRRNDFPDDIQPVKPVTYSVIKSGLVGLTRYLATYWAEQGIRSNALSPGGVLNGQGEEFVQRLNDLIPLGRMAAKDEYRGALQFLCSDASAYMNGQNVIIDGGRSVW